jgi:hypothetical protein
VGPPLYLLSAIGYQLSAKALAERWKLIAES